MQPIRGVLAAAVLLVHLLVQAEGAKRTCPVISNFTANAVVLPIGGGEEPEEPALLLAALFVTNDRSACQCSLHEVIRGRLKLKARVNRCFGSFGVTVNEGMHRVSIECKKRRCPRVMETRDLDAKAIDCGHPGDIENGNVTYSSTFAGSFATYSCNDGYQLDPPYGTIRFCTQLGNWSGDIPTCVAIDCGHPGDIENGQAIFTTTTFGSTATYSCDEGYQLQPYPEYSRICLQGGNWIGELPVCVADCGPPPEIANGTIIGGFFTTVGNTAFYFCNDFDATLVGNDTIACLADGTWEDPPMCVPPIDCGLPPPIANGTVSGIGTGVGSTAYYACLDSNYTLVGNGSRSIVCRDDGTWEDPPKCKPAIDCGPPPQLANGRASYFRTTQGSYASYFCNFGYNREGARRVICNANGMWDQPPTCKLAE